MIKSIEKSSIHRISSGQVLVDLQTAVKELVENSLDAGATTIDVKFKDYGLTSFEVIDNGSGIAPEDYDHVAMKHYTSKLSTFEDLTTVQTFGFRGEALFSLCALSERVTITTATAKEAPMGTVLEFDNCGRVKSRSGKIARQRGTTIHVEGLFAPLPVRRKELQRNSKREFGKTLTLLSAYALVPCTKENKGVRLSVVHILDKGRKSDQIRTDGKPSLKDSISSLWGPKQVDSLTELSLNLEVVPEKTVLKRQANPKHDGSATTIEVRGLISKFSPGNGRAGPDRQFFFINGRPCNPSKIQKAFNEVYRSFNSNQSPFIVADFIVPTTTYDVNVSPDKRTILLHSENALVDALKEALEASFAPARSTFAVQLTQSKIGAAKKIRSSSGTSEPLDISSDNFQDGLVDLCDPDANADINLDLPKDADDLIVRRSATPTLAVPGALLEREEVQAPSSEETTLHDAGQHESPIPRSSPAEPFIPSIQPRRRSPSPVPTIRRIPSPIPTKAGVGPVQMVLDTTKVTWTMRPSSETTEEHVRKKRKIDELRGTDSRRALRSQLLSFVSSGSQVDSRGIIEQDGQDSDTNSEADGIEEDRAVMEEDELMEEEIEEIRMDAEADRNESLGSKGPLRWSVTNNNKANAAGLGQDDPLFLPEPEELGTSQLDDQTEVEGCDHDYSACNSEVSLHPESASCKEDIASESGKSKICSSTVVSLEDICASSSTDLKVEVVRTGDLDSDAVVTFGLELVNQAWNVLSSEGDSSSSSIPESPGLHERDVRPVDRSAGLSNTSDDKGAERELARVIDKEDFASMEIIGQFNLGFIIARRRLRGRKTAPDGPEGPKEDANTSRVELDDLFIIDQHAADEKYNFETLQQTTKIDSQKLYKPRPLELTAADELLALENIDVLKNNGFEITLDDTAEPSQGRIRLVAQPVSGSTNFDMKDLEELLHLMQDWSAGQKMVRCSTARAMFAMRACRKSVMIGTALNWPQMTSIVRHMGTMDQPWNCPHGRPTMRHLTSLDDVFEESRETTSTRQINWDNL